MKSLGIPGAALGLVQHGKVVFADGFGVRDLDGAAKPDGDTLFMIASNTKALTTLMLAKLVDERQLTPPSRAFCRLSSSVTQIRPAVSWSNTLCVRAQVCRGRISKDVTPERALAGLARIQPTTKFGETYQYSTSLAGAGGFVGGHVAFPGRELGAAYDKAMRTRVFAPLGMTATTFDYARALKNNHASPHGLSGAGQVESRGLCLVNTQSVVRETTRIRPPISDNVRFLV